MWMRFKGFPKSKCMAPSSCGRVRAAEVESMRVLRPRYTSSQSGKLEVRTKCRSQGARESSHNLTTELREGKERENRGKIAGARKALVDRDRELCNAIHVGAHSKVHLLGSKVHLRFRFRPATMSGKSRHPFQATVEECGEWCVGVLGMRTQPSDASADAEDVTRGLRCVCWCLKKSVEAF